jgi:hypothetical protein
MPSPFKPSRPSLAINTNLSPPLKIEKKSPIPSPSKPPIPPLDISIDSSILLKATIKLLMPSSLKQLIFLDPIDIDPP